MNGDHNTYMLEEINRAREVVGRMFPFASTLPCRVRWKSFCLVEADDSPDDHSVPVYATAAGMAFIRLRVRS
jgi:hypothetical protein